MTIDSARVCGMRHVQQEILGSANLGVDDQCFSTRALNVLSEAGISNVLQVLTVDGIHSISKASSCGKKTFEEILLCAVERLAGDISTVVAKYAAIESEIRKIKDFHDEADEVRLAERWDRMAPGIKRRSAEKEAMVKEEVTNITILKRKAKKYDSILRFAMEDRDNAE